MLPPHPVLLATQHRCAAAAPPVHTVWPPELATVLTWPPGAEVLAQNPHLKGSWRRIPAGSPWPPPCPSCAIRPRTFWVSAHEGRSQEQAAGSTASPVTEALGGADSLTCQGRRVGDSASARPQPRPWAAAAPPLSPGHQGCPGLSAGSGEAPSSLCGRFPPVCPAAPEAGPGQAPIPARSLQPKPLAHMGPKGMFSLRGPVSPGSPLGVMLWSQPQTPDPGSELPRAHLGCWVGQADRGAASWPLVLQGPACPRLRFPLWEEPTGPFLAGRRGPRRREGAGTGHGPWAARCARSSLSPNGLPQAPRRVGSAAGEEEPDAAELPGGAPAASPTGHPRPEHRGPAGSLRAQLPAAPCRPCGRPAPAWFCVSSVM